MTNPSTSDSLQPRLMPRTGHTLLVLGIARISTVHQDQRSLEDQEALYRAWLDRHAGHPYQLDMIAGRGSGELLDRVESLQAETDVESRRYDLVIAEDLARIFRRFHANIFCELCEDCGTRLIAINDQVDTGQDNWRLLAGFASMRHRMYNADTAKRIRRSLRNRFQQGGLDELSRVEKQKAKILWDQQQLLQVSDKPLAMPSAADIRRQADLAFVTLTTTSPEFGRLLRRLIPRIVVYPYQLCDGGKVAQRAHFGLHLAPLLPPGPGSEQLAAALQKALVVVLYDPPQREAYRTPVMELTANGLKQRDIAWELDITQQAVQRAVALHRRVQAMEIRDPYLRLDAPPENESRLCRHLHPRYHFEPLADRPEPPPSS